MKPRSYWPKRVLAAYHAQRQMRYRDDEEYRIIQVTARRYGLWCKVVSYRSGRVVFDSRDPSAEIPKVPNTLKDRPWPEKRRKQKGAKRAWLKRVIRQHTGGGLFRCRGSAKDNADFKAYKNQLGMAG